MKLRIHADSIRLRLKQSEVLALAEGREVAEVCPMLPEPLTYILRPDRAVQEIVVRGEGQRITLLVPAEWLEHWHKDNRVGFDGFSGGLHVLIEKDFKCLHPRSETDNEDCFEHPDENKTAGAD